VDLSTLLFATLLSMPFVALKPFLFVTTPFWWCEFFLAYVAFHVRLHSFLVWRDACYGLLAFSFRSLLFGEARGCFSCRLALGCKVSSRDILHEREMAQPVLLPTIIDIHDLPRFGFVSTSCFLVLMWGKVDLI